MPLFGAKKKAPPPKESISKLRETLDMLEKREMFLQKKIDQQTADAKKYMAQKNKRAALMCLKRKKTYETQMEKLSGARMTIEQQVMTLEGANVSLEAMSAMKMGAASMKTIHSELNIDKVDDTMEEIREQMDLANEINDAISQPIGSETFDDDELLSELNELEQENLDEQLLQGVSVSQQKLPSVPTKVPTTATKSKAKPQIDEDAELAALEASMS
jgi:charged multivesicular body protein 4